MNESKDEEDSRSHPPFFKTEVEHSSSGKAPVLEESALKSTILLASLIFTLRSLLLWTTFIRWYDVAGQWDEYLLSILSNGTAHWIASHQSDPYYNQDRLKAFLKERCC